MSQSLCEPDETESKERFLFRKKELEEEGNGCSSQELGPCLSPPVDQQKGASTPTMEKFGQGDREGETEASCVALCVPTRGGKVNSPGGLPAEEKGWAFQPNRTDQRE